MNVSRPSGDGALPAEVRRLLDSGAGGRVLFTRRESGEVVIGRTKGNAGDGEAETAERPHRRERQ